MNQEAVKGEAFVDMMEQVLEDLHVGISITDGQGTILRTGKSCEVLYGIKCDSYNGEHISVLEQRGVFNPSLSLIVLKTKEKVTMIQPDRLGQDILVTATPILDPKTGEILYVVSYASWDITDVKQLHERYSELKNESIRNKLELDSFKSELLAVEIQSKNPRMSSIIEFIDKSSQLSTAVLICGEAGTGKTHLAKYVHKKSRRMEKPFIKMSCSAFSNNILSDELFGYIAIDKKSGEAIEKVGLCEVADKGTLFLEDIEEMDEETQKSFLYLLKNKSYFKKNCPEIKVADLRVIVTSRVTLKELEHVLLPELFYRLSVLAISLPKLDERPEDIPYFIDFFLKTYNKKYRKQVAFSPEAIAIMRAYHWPGNINELKYVVKQLVLVSEDELVHSYHLPENISPFSAHHFTSNINLTDYLEYHERRLILQVYDKCKTTVSLAKFLGISQPTAVRKLQKYRIEGETLDN